MRGEMRTGEATARPTKIAKESTLTQGEPSGGARPANYRGFLAPKSRKAPFRAPFACLLPGRAYWVLSLLSAGFGPLSRTARAVGAGSAVLAATAFLTSALQTLAKTSARSFWACASSVELPPSLRYRVFGSTLTVTGLPAFA